MPWFLVDDHFHSHPHAAKAIATEPAALGLWVVAGSWSSAHLTDGVVPDDVLPQLLPDSVKLAEALVTARLWKRVKGGYKFVPGVTCKIPQKEAVENERKNAAERQRRSREAKLSRRDSGVTNAVSHSAHPGSDPGVVSSSVVNRTNGSNARASPAVIDAIMKEIYDTTGKLIDDTWAMRIAADLLQNPAISNPCAYVRQAIRKDPDPAARFLPNGRPGYERKHARKDDP